MPKLREVIGCTKTNSYCPATVGDASLKCRRTIKMGITKVGNQAKPLKYYKKKKKVICYQLRPDVQTYRHPPRYTAVADASAAEIDVCTQKCQVAA